MNVNETRLKRLIFAVAAMWMPVGCSPNTKPKLRRIVAAFLRATLLLGMLIQAACAPSTENLSLSSADANSPAIGKNEILIDDMILKKKSTYDTFLHASKVDGLVGVEPYPDGILYLKFLESYPIIPREPGKIAPLQYPPLDEIKAKMFKACARWSAVANVKCVEYSGQGRFHKVLGYSGGCAAHLGSSPDLENGNGFYLSPGCFKDESLPTLTHEIGHAFGLHHEHQRPDRDQYLKLNWWNAVAWAPPTFDQLVSPSAVHIHGPYDFQSIMHYSNSGVAGIAKPGTLVFEPLPQYSQFIGKIGLNENPGLSIGDGETMSAIYGPPIAPPLPPASCPSSASATSLSIGTSLTCNCTSSAISSGSVYGTLEYKASSKICRAAVHAGVITTTGGVVKTLVAAGKPSYTGSTNNGVTSLSASSSSKSFSFGSSVPSPTPIPNPSSGVSSVLITSPSSGASFSSGATVMLTVSAQAVSGATISKVEFYDGSVNLGQDTMAPYSLLVSALSVGSRSITAKAFDGSGQSKTSSAVTIMITSTSVYTQQVINGYYQYLPGCLVPSTQAYWENYLATGGSAANSHFIETLRAASTPQTIAGCYNWMQGSARTQSITAIYSRYLPGCLTSASLNTWENWFNSGGTPADFVWTAQANAQTCN